MSAMAAISPIPRPPSPTPMFIPVGPIMSHPIPKLSASAEGRNPKTQTPGLKRPGARKIKNLVDRKLGPNQARFWLDCPRLRLLTISKYRGTQAPRLRCLFLYLWHRHSCLCGFQILDAVDRRRPRLRTTNKIRNYIISTCFRCNKKSVTLCMSYECDFQRSAHEVEAPKGRGTA